MKENCNRNIFYFLLMSLFFYLGSTDSTINVIQCIEDELKMKPLQSLCAKSKGNSCINSVYGMTKCFLNNQCYSQGPADQMNVHCWNCWADFLTQSDQILAFQSNIKSCKAQGILSFGVIVLLLTLSMLLL